MATIAYIQLANIRPQSYQLRLVANTFVHRSEHSGSTRTLTVPGSRWHFACEYRSLNLVQQGIAMGWLAELEGQGGRFFGFHLQRDWPIGTCKSISATASGVGTVLATSFTATGLGANATLLPGDFFSISGYLYVITAAMAASGAGVGLLFFKPGLRVAHGPGAPLTFYRPSTTFKLTADDLGLTYRPAFLADMQIDAEEAFV